MKRLRALFTFGLVLMDAVMSLLAFYLAYRLRVLTQGSAQIGPFSDYILLAGVQVATTLVVFFFNKFYHRRRAPSTMDEFYRVFGAVSVATLLTIAFVGFVLRNTVEYQRSMILYAWAASLATISLGRAVYGACQRWVQRRGYGLDRVLIVGTGEVGRTILQKIQYTPGLGYQVVGFADANHGPDRVMGVPVLGSVQGLPAIIERHSVNEVIIGLPEATHQELVGIISQCEREKVSIRVFPDVFQIMASEVTIGDLGGLPLLTIRDVALRGWKLTLKRIVDVVLSSAALLFLSPLMMATAILVKLDSPGPALFVQQRMGLDAKPFPMIKFRSMRRDAEAAGAGWTTENDPRRHPASAHSSGAPQSTNCRSSSTC